MKKRLGLKLLILMLVLSLTISMAGCGITPQQGSETEKANMQAETPAEAGVVENAVDSYFENMPSDIYKIDQNNFVDMVKSEEDIFILDIRKAEDYEKGHIKGAVNIPWGIPISENLDKLPGNKPIMLYCYTGQTAGQTVALLNMAGFEVRTVNLGWDLGISKVEGIDEIIETTSNDFSEVESLEIAPEMKTAIEEYFNGMEELKGTTYENYKISEEDAKALLDAEDDSIVFLSIRDAEDYAKGHIKGAVNIPWGAGMEKQFNKLPKGKKIIVYCYTGQTAGQTVAGLRLLGYDAVSLNAGMGTDANAPNGWINKGYSVEQ